MDHWIYIALGIAAFVALFALLFWLEFDAEPDEETQDDFHTSATRWGYLADRRKGGE